MPRAGAAVVSAAGLGQEKGGSGKGNRDVDALLKRGGEGGGPQKLADAPGWTWHAPKPRSEHAAREVVGGISLPHALVPAVASPGELDFPVRPAGR